MRLMQLFKNKKAEAPVADTRIDARDLEFTRDPPFPLPLQQEGPMIPLRLAGLQKVAKWCHPGKSGKRIICPVCASFSNVSHFGWTTLRCPVCHTDVEKYDWYLAAAPEDVIE